jgi:DNA-directed RNA polymerase subunit M/transcription elongation factor TFIIS
MRFCNVCGRAMVRETETGTVRFRCACGAIQEGSADDARIGGAVLGAAETIERYRRLIQSAAFDRTNQQIRRNCVKCGLDYMTQIRVGVAEIVIYRCKCGHEEMGANVKNDVTADS